MRRIAASGFAAAVAMAATLTMASPSAADGTSDGLVTKTVSAANQAATVDYWTTDRLLDAVPGSALLLGRVLDEATDVVSGLPVAIPGLLADGGLGGLLGGLFGGGGGGDGGGGGGGSDFLGDYYTGGGLVAQTTGKVFFTLGGVDYQCSGSSVSADNHDLVLTAGHCLNAGPGEFATNFTFIPGYDDGAAPYGQFPARKLATTSQWKTAGDLNFDVGFAAVSPVGGADLADTVGAQGIAFNQPRGELMYSFGYPAESPYDGTDIAWCHSVVFDDSKTSDQGMDCNMTGGSSGGPWFIDYNEASGTGLLNSVNSFGYVGLLGLFSPAELYGPYFGTAIQNLYATAEDM